MLPGSISCATPWRMYQRASRVARDTAQAAAEAWRHVADQLRPRFRDLAALMDQAETDVLAFMAFPRQH
jgi:putative transposase